MGIGYIAHESFGVNLVRNTPEGETHAKRNFDLCRAVDLTSLAVVLNEMVATRAISRRQADAFEAQAGGLLASLLTENDRSFIGSKHQSTAEVVRRFGIEGIPQRGGSGTARKAPSGEAVGAPALMTEPDCPAPVQTEGR
jgi:hypothetical protein